MSEIMTTPEIRVATERLECNASHFIKDCLDDIKSELSFAQKRDVVKARENNWHIMPGESYRYYVWGPGTEEECECCEIPAMSKICSDLDLWP